MWNVCAFVACALVSINTSIQEEIWKQRSRKNNKVNEMNVFGGRLPCHAVLQQTNKQNVSALVSNGAGVGAVVARWRLRHLSA